MGKGKMHADRIQIIGFFYFYCCLFKIQNIFASVGYMLENENVLRKNEQVDLNSHYSSINIDEYEYNKIEKLALSQFLEKISLNKYLLNFVTNGFDNTDFLVKFFIFD